jgi:hypothetical protein
MKKVQFICLLAAIEICNKFIDIKDETCEDKYFEMKR